MLGGGVHSAGREGRVQIEKMNPGKKGVSHTLLPPKSLGPYHLLIGLSP